LTGLPVFNFVAAQCALLVRLDRVIRRERVDVVRASDPLYLGLLGLTLARWNGIPLVVRLIANYDSDFYAVGRPAYPRLFKRRWVEKRVDRFVLAGADLVAAGNADLLQYALVNGASEDRSTVFLVGGAIDPIHFETEPSERASVREELGLGDRPFLVLVSRLELPKHPEDVIAVLGDVRRQVPDMVAVFVGDGSMRTQLEKMAAELGLRDAVVFAGDRDQPWIASALTSATVVVSPLTGRALVEGALSGTPIVAYDVDWHSEMVRSGETGLLVPYRDTGAMAEKVCELVRDPAYAAGLADRARRETAELMNPAALAEHERQQYVRLLADARGGRRRT
jgi:glycosyltransferase involved in cell wall biosynthesis